MHKILEQKPFWYTTTLKILHLCQMKIFIPMAGGFLGQEYSVDQFWLELVIPWHQDILLKVLINVLICVWDRCTGILKFHSPDHAKSRCMLTPFQNDSVMTRVISGLMFIQCLSFQFPKLIFSWFLEFFQASTNYEDLLKLDTVHERCTSLSHHSIMP